MNTTEDELNRTMKKAILETLKMWETLDEYHKGRNYRMAKENLEKMLKLY